MNDTPSVQPTVGCLLQLRPGVAASLHFYFSVSVPCGPGSSPLSLPLWIPGQSLAADVAGCLPEGEANPTLGLPLWIPGQSLAANVAGCLPEGEANPTLGLPLWIPGQSLAADVAGWLPECVANPAPLYSTDQGL